MSGLIALYTQRKNSAYLENTTNICHQNMERRVTEGKIGRVGEIHFSCAYQPVELF